MEMARASSDRSDRIARVRKKLANTDIGGQSGGWSPKSGRNVIRILPGVGDMDDFFWQDVGKHYPPESRRSFTCPKFTIGAECPICDFVDTLYRAGDESSKQLASKLRRQKKFWMNVIDREDEESGPKIFRNCGPMIFKQIAALVQDPDYGEMLYDEYEGLDLIITKTGEKLNTEYAVQARRKASPLHEDDDVIDEWMEDAKDLSVVELSDDPEEDAELMGDDTVVSVMPYERLKAEFELLDLGDDEEEEELPFEDDDEEDEVQAAIKRRRERGKRSRTRRRR
jgi:hypothetical protein